MTSEAVVLRRLIRILEEYGVYYVRVIQASRAGSPDLIACLRGKFYAFETKGTRGQLSELQKLVRRRVGRSMGIFLTVYPDDLQRVESMVRHMMRLTNKSGGRHEGVHRKWVL